MSNIHLPAPLTSGGMPLLDALRQRLSARNFAPRDLDLQTLSNLLWAAWGYSRENKRTAPSSHNRQDIEIYVTLKEGTYLWNAVQNVLILINDRDLRAATGLQDYVGEAPVNLVLVSETSRITGKDEQGITEAIFANTGYIQENIYLFCAAFGLITVARAMVDRVSLAAELGLRPTQRITFAQSVGYPAV